MALPLSSGAKRLKMNKSLEHEGTIKEAFFSIGQGQIFRFWKELNLKERELFIEQLSRFSPKECLRAWDDIHAEEQKVIQPDIPSFIPRLNPFCPKSSHFREIGEDLLQQGKVAAFTVAGGQGTRLGHMGPKGTYNCTPIKKEPLFKHFAQSIKFFEQRYGQSPRWFILTSLENHQETQKYFNENNFFGLEKERIFIFKQGMMPVYDLSGKLLLKEKNQLVTSPNGHGGSFGALLDSGALGLMEEEGIDYLSYFQVDNPMVYCLDPAFIGLHQHERSEMSSKAVQKQSAQEKVGTFLQINQKLHVVEYSDLPKQISEEKNPDGTLRFPLGNIAIHILNREFVKRVAEAKESANNRLRYHGALKAVNHLDEAGNHVEAQTPNALKAETFLFDALPLAQNPLVMEIERGEEFAPIKNAQGLDSLETSHKLQLLRAQKWLKNENYEEIPEKVEISPLFAPTWPHFSERIAKNRPEIGSIAKEKVIFDELGTSVLK